MATEQGYRVPEVTRVVGITYRQLDYWARTGLVTPSIRDAEGSGSQRLYSFQDLATLRELTSLPIVLKGILHPADPPNPRRLGHDHHGRARGHDPTANLHDVRQTHG